jgi:hypothetical protein
LRGRSSETTSTWRTTIEWNRHPTSFLLRHCRFLHSAFLFLVLYYYVFSSIAECGQFGEKFLVLRRESIQIRK